MALPPFLSTRLLAGRAQRGADAYRRSVSRVIPAIPGDSGLLLRQAYLNGSYPAWRLPLLLATGLAGMALAFFSVRARYMQIKPQYRKMRRAHRRHDLHSHGCRAECSAFTRSCGRSFS